MLVNENINVDTRCHRMPPTKGVTFTNVSLDGATPTWTTRANCNGNSACDCGNSATVSATGATVSATAGEPFCSTDSAIAEGWLSPATSVGFTGPGTIGMANT